MSKRFSFLISLVLLLCLAGGVCAQTEVTWDNNDGAGDRLWDTTSNWDLDRVPAANEIAVIDSYSDDGNGPIIQGGIGAVADYVETGYWLSPPGGVESVMTMTGGTLTAGGWIDIGGYQPGNYRFDLSGGQVTVTGYGEGTWEGMWFAFVNDSNGVMNMSAGDVNVFGGLWLGWNTNSHGIFNMTGGTYTGDYIYVGAFSSSGGGGRMDLHGGTIHCSDFSMGPVSYLNISGGVLTCDTDLTVPNGWIFDPEYDTAIVNTDGVRGDAPGYSGTVATLVARGTVTAYDVNSGDIITDSVNYPSEAGLRALVKIDYDVTNADMTTVSAAAVDPNLAYNPSPFDKARRVQPAEFSLISWSAGTNAAQHDVYFGTDETAVANANTLSEEYRGRRGLATTTYPPSIEHVFGKDYFWRIDEVNSSGGVEWPGSVWSFTADDHAVVDDFHSYLNNTELYEVWDDGYVNFSNAQIFLEGDPNIIRDSPQALNVWYYNYDKTTGSWFDAQDMTELAVGSDWTIGGVKALTLYMRGDPCSVINSNEEAWPWVELEDTSSNSGYVLYPADDIADILDDSWHEWHIDLSIIDACGVTLSAIDRFTIGIGGPKAGQSKAGTKNTNYMWFDDIELWPPYCRTELIATDFTGDCITDGLDLAVMAADWLLSDGLVVSAPPADAPKVWYRFDEGGGGTINNDGSLGSSYNGIFPGAPNNPTWDSDGAPAVDACDPNYSMSFDGGDFVEIPVLNLNTNTATISAWVKRAGDQPDWAGIVFCRGDNTTSGIGFRDGLKTSHNLSYHWDGWWWWYDAGLTIPDGQWTFTSLVVEEEQATLYMSDGTTWDSATNVSYHGPDEWDANTSIGQDPQGGRVMTGKVDDVRIYDRSLKVGEVLGLAGVSTSFYDPLEEPTNLVVRVPDPAVDPNYYPSNPDIINFGDFEVLADKWLDGPTLWP